MEATTVVLIGKTGNGKSATGNSILGQTEFVSKKSGGSVTTECKLGQRQWKDGRTIKVVDTPGIFDTNVSEEFILREIVKCIDLAMDGVHAFILVLSLRSRFTKEETAVIDTMQMLFGAKVIDYMVVLLTGGDELDDEDGVGLQDYLKTCPKALAAVLRRCDSRVVVFDNKTKSKEKKEDQIAKLLEIVDRIVAQNSNRAYTNELFQEAKKRAEKNPHIEDQMKEKEKYYEDQLIRKDKAFDEERKQKDKAFEEERKQKDVYIKQQMEILKEMMEANKAAKPNLTLELRCTIS